MDEEWENQKKELRRKFRMKQKIILILTIVIIICLLAAGVYFITIDDGTYKEDDWSSTNYGASQYINNVSMNSDGTLSSSMTSQELWDKMKENGSRVDEYLDKPEELLKLMRAEIVTQYPDIREDPDKQIDWDNLEEDELQGIIKFKRADEENNTSTMIYADPETFQSYIDEYNSTGSETAKKNALTHFTLKKTTSTNTNNVEVIAVGEGVMTDVSQAIINATSTTPWPGAELCSQWVNDVYDNAGLKADRNGSAYKDAMKHVISTDMSAIPIGAAVYGTGKNSDGAGHVGIYLGSGKVIDSKGSSKKIDVQTLEEWISWQTDSIGEYQGWIGWGWADNNKTRGTTQDPNVTKNNDDKEDKSKKTTGERATVTQVDGDGYNEEYTSSAGITYKLYRQYEGSYAANNYWNGKISNVGCGPTALAILASGLTNLNYTPGDIAANMSYTSYETLQAEMEALGMTAEVIQSPSAETIQDNLKNGKVMLVSVNSNTIFTNDSHIMALVDINTSGQVYIGNPSSNSVYGWYDISEIMKGCKYIVVTDAGAAGIAKSNNTSEYVAVVASWKQIDTIVTTDDPEVEAYSTSQYSMATTTVNYQEMVEPYTMPFDLLWAFLVIGEEKEFVFDLADLVYNSDIQITIYDNLTVNTDINDWNYTQRTRAILKYYDITAKYKDYQAKKSGQNDVHDPYGDDKLYNTVKTVVTKTNTINVVLTRANIWMVDYKNEYTYANPDETWQDEEITINDQAYPSQPNSTGNDFSCEHIESIKQSLRATVIGQYLSLGQETGASTNISATDVKFDENYYVEYFQRYVDISDKITNKISSKKYTKGVPDIKEKTDEDTAPNFVTIFNKKEHRQNRKNVLSVTEWLFEIIETNDSTKEMLDLIKYLLYKATGNNYGVTEYDFSEYDPANFTKINSGVFGSDILLDFLKSWESSTIWKYQTGQIGYSDVVARLITEDRTKYVCYDDGLGTRNFGFGVCHYYNGHFNHQEAYASLGVDITQYFEVGSTLDVDIVDKVKLIIIQHFREYIESKLSEAGISLEEHQLHALDAICYQWGPYGTIEDFIAAYQKYGDTEELRQNFTHNGDKPFLSGDNGRDYEIKRANANWTLFHEGRYLTPDGEELNPSNYSSANVGEIASVPLEQRMSYVFPNGTPNSESEMAQYLTTITVPINNSSGVPTTTQITCNKVIANELVEIYTEMQAVGFKITDTYSYDWRDMASGTGSLSHHAYGLAIDINADANPASYWGEKPDPSSPYYINEQIVAIWKKHGFYWGGDWSPSYYDPMHFSYTNQ